MSRATLFRLVPALGLTQIISWGALYYSIAVLGASIRDELGLSAAALFGAYSLSLLLSALTAPLAGSAFWPLSLKGLEWFGWRDTLSGFALLQIAICLPLHLAFVPRTVTPIVPARIGSEYEHGTLPPESRRPALIALGVAFALNGFIVSALTVHLITVLQGKGLPLESAVW